MKASEVPQKAWNAPSTPIPKKSVYDWEEMLAILEKKGFVIIESDDIRITRTGAEECIQVKAFNCFVRVTKKRQLRTRRLSRKRWFCTL